MKYLMANYLHYPEEFVQIFLQAFDNILYVSQHRITLGPLGGYTSAAICITAVKNYLGAKSLICRFP